MQRQSLKMITLIISSMLLYLLLLPFIQYPLTTLLKPVPIILLMIFTLYAHCSKLTKILLLVALGFSALGDILLTFSATTMVLAGILAFMVTQCIYSFIFLKNGKIQKKRVMFFLPIMVLVMALFYYIWPSLGEMRTPAIGYVFLLTFMVFCSFQVKQHALLLCSGAIIFVISDFLVSLDLFLMPNNILIKLCIMFLYYLAQFLLVMGITKPTVLDNSSQVS